MSTGEVVSCACCACIAEYRSACSRITGGQAGIITDGNFSRASISGLNPARLWTALEAGEVPVVAGFQGISGDTLQITQQRDHNAGPRRIATLQRWLSRSACAPHGAKYTPTCRVSSQPTREPSLRLASLTGSAQPKC